MVGAMPLTNADLTVVGVAAAVVLIAVVWALLSRRAVARRLGALTARMGESDLQFGGRAGLETGLAKLERVVDATVAVASEARSAESLMKEALFAVPQGVVVGDDQGNVSFQNPAAEALLGPTGTRSQLGDAVQRLLEAAADGVDESATADVDGPPPRKLQLQGHALHDSRQTLGGIVVIEDRSEHTRHEAVRREFVDNIGQELKRPVGALGLLAETLAGERDPVVVARLSRRLHNEAQRVSRVVDDLMLLSRIDADEHPAPEAVPVHLVVAQAAERVRPAAQDKDMTVNFGEPAQRLTVMGDRRQLVSAVYNLLDNAVKFSPNRSVVEVRGRPDGRFVEISVRDRGAGIPAIELEHIFERFYRVAGPKTRAVGGTGLGLAIVRHVAGIHEGDVRVESTEGEGSTFVLRLPAGPPLAAPASAPKPAPAPSKADPSNRARVG
jgi:two-component system, OmpR family, sensor histidine kinase SenX3